MDLFTLFKLSILISLFFIPLFVFVTANGVFERNVMAGIDTSSASPDFSPLLKLRIYMGLFYIPCFVCGAFGLEGGFNFIKKYSFNEGAYLKRDFFGGIKSDFKVTFSVSFIYSLVFYLLTFALNYLALLNFSLFIYLCIICLIFALFLMVQAFFALAQIPIYTNKTWMIIKTSFFFACNKLFKGLGIGIITFLPLVIVPFIGIQVLDYIVMLLYVFLGFGNAVLLISLFAEDAFDELVNKTQFPSIYRKGLYSSPVPSDKDEDFLKDLDYE